MICHKQQTWDCQWIINGLSWLIGNSIDQPYAIRMTETCQGVFPPDPVSPLPPSVADSVGSGLDMDGWGSISIRQTPVCTSWHFQAKICCITFRNRQIFPCVTMSCGWTCLNSPCVSIFCLESLQDLVASHLGITQIMRILGAKWW